MSLIFGRKLEAGKQILADRKFDMGTTLINNNIDDVNVSINCEDDDDYIGNSNNSDNKESIRNLFDNKDFTEYIETNKNESVISITYSGKSINAICQRCDDEKDLDLVIPKVNIYVIINLIY